GAVLAAGDVDSDGVSDLVVSAPGEDINGIVDCGIVHVIPGRAGLQLQTNLAVSRDGRSLPSPFTGLQTGARFGSALAVGHFRSGLGAANLIVGAPDQHVIPVGSVRPLVAAGTVAVFDAKNPFTSTSVDPLGTTVTVWTAESFGDTVQSSGR